MSKFEKASKPEYNSVLGWQIVSIQKSQKTGKMKDSSKTARAKIFNIKDINGKIDLLPKNFILTLICYISNNQKRRIFSNRTFVVVIRSLVLGISHLFFSFVAKNFAFLRIPKYFCRFQIK